MLVQERVGNGHPDKICDLVAERVKLWLLNKDKSSRTAIEVCTFPVKIDGVLTSKLIIFGEYSIPSLEINEKSFNNELRNYLVSYLKKLLGADYFDYLNPIFEFNISEQSKEILSLSKKGAGDQGIIVGQYKKEVEYLFEKTEDIKKQLDSFKSIGRDWKMLVDYSSKKLIINFHFPKFMKKNNSLEEIERHIKKITKKVFPDFSLVTSNYEKGSILSDSGLTGRKIFCDFPFSYMWGGGAVWGKDATKVDNSALIYLRSYCKEYARKHNLDNVQITTVYNIGKNAPVSVEVLVNGKSVDSKKMMHHFNVDKIIESVSSSYPSFPKINL